MSENRTLDLSWVQAAASALAAVSSAVLLSTVGVAGTLVGAAVGSVAATVGTAVYKYYLSASQDRMALAREAARERLARARAADLGHVGPSTEVVRAEAELQRVEEEERQEEEEVPAARRADWREALKVLPWKRIGLVSAGLFVVVMAVLLLFELLAGGPVSSFTGGTDKDHAPRTSIPFVGGTEEPAPSPTPTSTESETPTDSPTGTDTSTSSPTASPTRSEPTGSPTASATEPTPSTTTTSSAPVPPGGTPTP